MELKGNQEAFDAMIAHMRAQKYDRSYTKDDYGVRSCVYRGERGLKCVVGALIQDEHYSVDLENLLVCDLAVKHALLDSGWGADVGLLEAMQSAHDNPIICNVFGMDADGVQFEEDARKAAKDYGLTYTPPA